MTKQHHKYVTVSCLAVSAALGAMSAPGTAIAQESGQQTDEIAANPPARTNEIVVVARRREENLQEVPSSIGLLAEQDIEARQIVGFQDLKNSIANVSTVKTGTAGGGYLTIRGLSGNSTPNIGVDSQIGLYVDGVYLGRAQSSGGDLTDLARVEVYRGPQGTLFGKNSTGGAINFITAAPTGEFGVEAVGAIGSLDRRYAKLTLNSPNLGGFAFRLTYQHEDYGGDVKNAYDGPSYVFGGYDGGAVTVPGFGVVNQVSEFGGRNSEAIVAKVRYDGIDGLTLDYKFDHSDTTEITSATQGFGFNSSFSGAFNARLYLMQDPGSVPLSFDKLKTLNQDGNGPTSLQALGHMLTANYDIDDHTTIRSISAYRQLDVSGRIDLDGGVHQLNGVPIAGFHATSEINQKQWSQELQLIGAYDSFDYLLGGFFFHEKGYQQQLQGGQINAFTLAFPFLPLVPGPDGVIPVPFGAVNQIDLTNNKAYAIYGSVNLRLIDNLEASIGGRYTWDRKNATDARFDPAVEAEFNDDRLTWDASLTYSITPDINLYTRYAKGYSAGGIARSQPFDAEKTESYEAGIKSEWFDRRLRFNATVFHSKTTDLQRSQFVSGVGVVYFNIGTLKVNGLEIEASANPLDGLTLAANYGYVDRKASNGDGPITPNQNLSLSATYDTPPLFDSAYLSFRVDADWRSKYYSSNLNNIEDRTFPDPLPAFSVIPDEVWSEEFASQEDYFNALMDELTAGDYWMANARVSLMDIPIGSGDMRVTGYVNNLFDKEGKLFVIDYGAIMGATFERERTYGIEVGFTF